MIVGLATVLYIQPNAETNAAVFTCMEIARC